MGTSGTLPSFPASSGVHEQRPTAKFQLLPAAPQGLSAAANSQPASWPVLMRRQMEKCDSLTPRLREIEPIPLVKYPRSVA